MMNSEYLSHKAVDVADKNPPILDESTSLAEAGRLMKKKGVSSILVGRDNQHVVGIVTERDIVYRVVAENKSPFKTTLKEIMSSPLVTVDEATAVKDAITLMRGNGIRRVPVVKKGQVLGMLTLKSIIGNVHDESIELAEVELPETVEKKVIMCPYCQSKFQDKQELSKHIDRLHLGSGLLEGDMRQW
jgi:CBS domain-containing protein